MSESFQIPPEVDTESPPASPASPAAQSDDGDMGSTTRTHSALDYLEIHSRKGYFSMETLKGFFPLPRWFVPYVKGGWKRDLSSDLVAGGTLGAMIVPNGMAYAMIAGLPPYLGLYTAYLSILVYFFFGTSKHLAAGPIPLASLVTNAAVTNIGYGSVAEQCAIASLLAIFAGSIQVVMGVTHFGNVLVDFLSRPLVSGFTSGAAIIIALSQIKYILGLHVKQYAYAWMTFYEICKHVPETNYVTLLFGIACTIVLGILKKKKPRFPGALFIVVAAILVSWYFELEKLHVDVVGDVPAGLPPLQVPKVDEKKLSDIFIASIMVCLIAFMESYSVARAIAYRSGYAIDGSQELVGIGMASIMSGFSQGYVSGGALARTAVNYVSGAKTQVGSLLTSAIVMIFLLFLTPLIYPLPLAALGAIILTAVPSLIDIAEAKYCFKNSKSDFLVLSFSFFTTLIAGIEVGVFASVALSVLIVIHKATSPYVAVLGRVPGSSVFRDQRKIREAVTYPHVLVVRIESSIFFANVTVFEDIILGIVQHGNQRALELSALQDMSTTAQNSSSPNDLESASKRSSRTAFAGYADEEAGADIPYYVVVLDASPLNDIDASAMHAMEDLLIKLDRLKVKVLLANVNDAVRLALTSTGIVNKLPEKESSMFDSVSHAVARANELVEERIASDLQAHSEQMAKAKEAPATSDPAAPGQLSDEEVKRMTFVQRWRNREKIAKKKKKSAYKRYVTKEEFNAL